MGLHAHATSAVRACIMRARVRAPCASVRLSRGDFSSAGQGRRALASNPDVPILEIAPSDGGLGYLEQGQST